MSDMQQLFLSYSRQELYFAEMLATRLKEAGLSVWFDLERLRPGEGWENSINNGLENMQGVVFVASKASLKSSYATQEWQAAIDRKLPVYVIIFEELLDKNGDTESQARLKALIDYERSHFIDFRTKFEKQTKKLITIITKQETHESDEIPELMRYGWRRLPFHVRNVVRLNVAGILIIIMLLIALGFGGLAVTFEQGEDYAFTESNFWFFLVVTGGIVALIAVFIHELRKILRREYRPTSVMLFSLFVVLIVSSVLFAVLQGFALIVGIIAFLYIVWAINFSNDWLRYAPRGIGGQGRRIKANGYKTPKLKEIQPASYRLDYVKADEQMARQINRHLEAVKHTPDNENYDYNLVIISNRASKELFDLATNNDRLTIGVVVSCVNNDGLDKRLMIEQLFDFRQHDKRTLQAVAQYLAAPDDSHVTYSHLLVPRDFQDPLTPRPIYYYANFVQWLCIGIILIIGFYMSALLSMISSDASLAELGENVTRISLIASVAGFIGVVIFFVVGEYILLNRLLVRRDTVRNHIILLTGFYISVTFLALSLTTIIEAGADFISSGAIISVLIGSVIIGLIASGITLIPMYRPLNNWLPHITKDDNQIEKLEVKNYPIITPSMRYHLSLLSGILVFLFLMFVAVSGAEM